MKHVENFETLQNLIDHTQATLVLFGGEHCGVCQVIKPKLEEMLITRYPEMTVVYADCQRYPSIGAQSSVFTLPVVRVYFEGQLFIEEIKAFSLSKLLKDLERPYKHLIVIPN
jgi:thioredoxin-like negative regulator of GroEL